MDKLDKSVIEEIRKMRKEGIGVKEIMDKFHINSRSTVYYHLYKTPIQERQIENINNSNPRPLAEKIGEIVIKYLKEGKIIR